MPDALLRVSRLDRQFYIGYPSELARREYFINKGVEEELIGYMLEKLEAEDKLVAKANEANKEKYQLIHDLDLRIENLLRELK
jgi:SpoVK/Ycf46/Vps4 family AAA+-type ATPase